MYSISLTLDSPKLKKNIVYHLLVNVSGFLVLSVGKLWEHWREIGQNSIPANIYLLKANNDVVFMFWLLTLNMFHTFF